jgi:ribosome modulation factor
MSATIPAAGSNVPPETILYHTHELARSKRKIDEANSEHRLKVKRAKDDGVPTDAILESIQWSKLDPEVRRQKIIDRVRVEAARYPQSAEVLPDLISRMDVRVSERMRYTDTLFDAEQRGYVAGKAGQTADGHTYPEGSELAATWRRGWTDGRAAQTAQMGEHARAANPSRKKPGKAAQADPNQLAMLGGPDVEEPPEAPPEPVVAVVAAKKRGGRPKGSKNKVKKAARTVRKMRGRPRVVASNGEAVA